MRSPFSTFNFQFKTLSTLNFQLSTFNLKDDAAGEHDVADAAVEALEDAATVVFVDEVVEGKGEGEHVLDGVVAVGEGEGEI